mgnify:CR=1 FL=1
MLNISGIISKFIKNSSQRDIDKLKSIKTIRKITVRISQVAYKYYEKQGFELFEIQKDFWADGFDMCNMIYKQL